MGEASDYATLLQMMLNDMALSPCLGSLILPALEGAAPRALGVAALPDSVPICSCYGVSKGNICQTVNNGTRDMAATRSCTRAATGYGGCSALMKQVIEHQLAK